MPPCKFSITIIWSSESIMSDTIPADIRRWAEKHTGSIQSTKALKGGISTSIYHLICENSDFVLRVIDNADWLAIEPDLAEHEASGLRLLANYDVPAPRFIAFDNGDECRMPVVLSTYMPGNIVLQPDDLNRWLRELALGMANLHRIDVPNFKWEYEAWFDIEKAKIAPQWIENPELWQIAVSVRQKSLPQQDSLCLIHRDYHPGNVLFQNGKISGIVDWINICRGSSQVDVAVCRIDVMCLHGVEAANQLMAYYEDTTGTLHQAEWDIHALLDFFDSEGKILKQVLKTWQEHGRTDLTLPVIYQRANAFLKTSYTLIDRIKNSLLGVNRVEDNAHLILIRL